MKINPFLLGLLLSLPTIFIVALFPKPQRLLLLALLLSFIAAIYLGFAISDGVAKVVAIESVVAVAFLVVSAAGVWRSPFILASGYLAHGVWDLLHHPQAIRTKVIRWWPPFCVVYDWIVAGFIFFWWRPGG